MGEEGVVCAARVGGDGNGWVLETGGDGGEGGEGE